MWGGEGPLQNAVFGTGEGESDFTVIKKVLC